LIRNSGLGKNEKTGKERKGKKKANTSSGGTECWP